MIGLAGDSDTITTARIHPIRIWRALRARIGPGPQSLDGFSVVCEQPKGPDEVSRALYRTLSEDQFLLMKKFVRRIFAHSVWDAPDTADQDISKALTKDDDTTAFNLFKERNLTVEWIL